MKLDRSLQHVLLELANTERVLNAGADSATLEQREYERLQQELSRMREAAGSAQMAVDDMELEILRIQEDERKLQRRERDDKAQLTAEIDPERRKDLEHDRYATKSRITDIHYELKEAHNEIHALRNNRDVHGAHVSDLERKVEVAQRAAEAANEAASNIDPREKANELRAQLPAEAIAAFEDRQDENDVGVAAFNGRVCGGCFIQLPAADRSRINLAPEDELPVCPNCESYLVRP